ncbi:ABC transporter [Streptomyces sp. B6B3]|uniref:ABC transporter n=1 Tax=Streptomyces sp. B6B3 TaxID=3153570 RepID=UPI00325EBFA2
MRGIVELRGAVAFEWVKLRSVRATWWSLVAATVLTVAASVVIGMSVKASEENGYEAAQPAPHSAAGAISIAQLGLVVLATLAVTSEYAHGTIATTLRGVPQRGRMLASKTLVTTAAIALTGLLLAVLGTVSAAPFMGEYGRYSGGDLLATALGVAGYLAALSVLTIGIGAMLRSAAGAITSLLMLLLAVPQLLRGAGPQWLRTAVEYLPGDAGTVLMEQGSEPYGAGRAAVVLLLWALAGALGGYAVLRARDA